MVLASAGSLPGSSYRICSDKISLLYTSYWCSDSPPPPHLLFLRDSCSRLGKDKTTLRPNYSQLHQLLKRISRKQLCQQPATAWRLLHPFPTIPVKPTGFKHGKDYPPVWARSGYPAPFQLGSAKFTSWLVLEMAVNQANKSWLLSLGQWEGNPI